MGGLSSGLEGLQALQGASAAEAAATPVSAPVSTPDLAAVSRAGLNTGLGDGSAGKYDALAERLPGSERAVVAQPAVRGIHLPARWGRAAAEPVDDAGAVGATDEAVSAAGGRAVGREPAAADGAGKSAAGTAGQRSALAAAVVLDQQARRLGNSGQGRGETPLGGLTGNRSISAIRSSAGDDMGGTSNTGSKTSTQTSNPWEPAVPALSGILGSVTQVNPDLTTTETNALDRLSANAQNAGQFAPQIGGLANTLLAGGGTDRAPIAQDAYNKYLSEQAATARGDYLDPTRIRGWAPRRAASPTRSSTASRTASRVPAAIRPAPARSGAGGTRSRDCIGAHLCQCLQHRARPADGCHHRHVRGGQSVGGALVRPRPDQAGQSAGRHRGGGCRDHGAEAPQLQALAVEAQRRGIPLQTMAQQMGIVLPAAQAFGTKSGTETSETTQGTNWGQLGVGAATAAAMFF